jgi:opacity protein-like surface antigen
MRGLFFLVFFCSALCAVAQLGIGIKGGLNISDVVINNVIDPDAESGYNFKAGLHAGIFATAEVGTRTSLAAELQYSNKGVYAITPINLHYIVLPALVRYALNDKFTAEAGPELGYLLAARSKYGNVGNIWNNKIDLGLDIGLQYNVVTNMTLGLRFNAGISSIIEDTPSSAQSEKIRYQNRVLQFSVAYKLLNLKLE